MTLLRDLDKRYLRSLLSKDQFFPLAREACIESIDHRHAEVDASSHFPSINEFIVNTIEIIDFV